MKNKRSSGFQIQSGVENAVHDKEYKSNKSKQNHKYYLKNRKKLIEKQIKYYHNNKQIIREKSRKEYLKNGHIRKEKKLIQRYLDLIKK